MYVCCCGEKLGDTIGNVAITRRPCVCGVKLAQKEFGAPHVFVPQGDPQRRRLGLPDKTPWEKRLDFREV